MILPTKHIPLDRSLLGAGAVLLLLLEALQAKRWLQFFRQPIKWFVLQVRQDIHRLNKLSVRRLLEIPRKGDAERLVTLCPAQTLVLRM